MNDSTFVSLLPSSPLGDTAALWREVRQKLRAAGEGGSEPTLSSPASAMEAGLSVIAQLDEAPPRTLHSAPLVSSSPLSPAVRSMLETREFGRAYDTYPIDLDAISHRLPALECPPGDVQFLACDRSIDDLSLSVDGLLQHRKRLLSASIDPARPRRHALVLGAGPGGLMTAIQMRLRDHHVVVCEQREVYARNRYIGVYKEVTHLMAALGMPESMTYDFSQYRGKRGIMLADIQTLLHAIALKLGVIVYMGAVPRRLTSAELRAGEIELQRATRGTTGAPGQSSIGITRWHHDTVMRARSGVAIRFDMIVEATGGRSGLRELLVGPDNVVSLRAIGSAAASHDPSLESFFADPEDHSAEYVESGYGCPPGLRKMFAAALLSGGEAELPDALPCFVSNIDASIFTRRMTPTAESLGLASRIGDRDLAIPHDWVVLECRLADQSLSRYHIEGPLPQSFEFGGKRVSTRHALDKLNPVSLLLRILYAMGVPFDAVDRRRLVEFYTNESSYGDTSDIVTTWVGTFRGLRLGGENPIWCGSVPGNGAIEYGIVGEALQNAWYRFGVGVDDAFAAAARFAEGLDLSPEERLSEARRFERVMTARSVQILYHLFAVARNTDQGVVGPVLTEYYMDEQHGTDLAEARLREVAQQGAEMLAAATDVRVDGADPLLDDALDYLRESWCRRVVTLLESFGYPPDLLGRTRQLMKVGGSDWRARAFAALEPALSPQHRESLRGLFALPEAQGRGEAERPHGERLVELGMGRYGWVSPWLRACALRALDPAAPGATAALERASTDTDPLIAETANAALSKGGATEAANAAAPERYLTIDKVVVLRDVNLFRAIPHQILAGVATLLTERWADPGERIFDKGDLGDCLYIIASGRVRVHDASRSFQNLIRHQVFGELSLLDAQPRAASATAVERTHLFRLAQTDFYALMSERPEITHAINRALCAMVRAADASNAVERQPDPAAIVA
jgi:CRP/FNR family transcriptional regulator, cyclic AMP receptor protein